MKTLQLKINHINEIDNYTSELIKFNANFYLVFGSYEFFETNVISEKLKSIKKNIIIAGCSTAGEIHNDGATEGSLIITCFKFKTTKINQASQTLKEGDNYLNIGKNLGKELISKDKEIKGIILLSLGHQINSSELLSGLLGCFPQRNQPVVTGGLAGDNGLFEKTYVCDTNGPSSQKVTAISFSGDDLCFVENSHAGWEPIGDEHQVTKFKNNILKQIDGIPALEFYKQKLGIFANKLPQAGLLFPMYFNNGTEKTIRTVINVDDEKNEIILAGDIPKNAKLKLMRASSNIILKDINENILFIKQTQLENVLNTGLVLAISCVGRKMLLGSKFYKEQEVIRQHFKDEMIAGFYSYGEIGKNQSIENSTVHNQTLSLLYIGENSV